MKTTLAAVLYFLLLGIELSAQTPPPADPPHPDTTKHAVQLVAVEPDVRLEVLDYGGSGPAMIFLSSLGGDAHDWDKFAPKFMNRYHVFAFTRRGFGASDVPAVTGENYGADRLGDDVLAVMEKLKLNRPILVGWSVAGEELSSVGSRFPDKVKALIYLDAGYPYAYYNRSKGEPSLDRAELRRLLEQASHENPINLELEKRLLASIEQNAEELHREVSEREKTGASPTPPPPPGMPPMPGQMIDIMTHGVKYTKIPVPILAIFAVPKDLNMISDPVERAKMEKNDSAFTNDQAGAFEAGLPNAHVVRIAHAGHDVFYTNESDVLREMNTFLKSLDRGSTKQSIECSVQSG